MWFSFWFLPTTRLKMSLIYSTFLLLVNYYWALYFIIMAYCQLLCAGYGFPLLVPRIFFDNVGMSLAHAWTEPRVCGYLLGATHLLAEEPSFKWIALGGSLRYFSEILMDSWLSIAKVVITQHFIGFFSFTVSFFLFLHACFLGSLPKLTPCTQILVLGFILEIN